MHTWGLTCVFNREGSSFTTCTPQHWEQGCESRKTAGRMGSVLLKWEGHHTEEAELTLRTERHWQARTSWGEAGWGEGMARAGDEGQAENSCGGSNRRGSGRRNDAERGSECKAKMSAIYYKSLKSFYFGQDQNKGQIYLSPWKRLKNGRISIT